MADQRPRPIAIFWHISQSHDNSHYGTPTLSFAFSGRGNLGFRMTNHLARRARRHGLRYVATESLPISRRRSGRGFVYLNPKRHTIRDAKTLSRIRALVIPPAWQDVRIADDPSAHIQAIGRDAEARLQYRYHDDWTLLRDQLKGERLLRFGKALPRIRARIRRDLGRRKTDRQYAAAVAGRLIDRALLRAGHTGSEDGGRGVATLLRRDVRLNRTKVFLNFTGKSGKAIQLSIRDASLLTQLRRMKQLGRKRLFVFRDDKGRRCRLTARDLNSYLREAAGKPVTAKTFARSRLQHTHLQHCATRRNPRPKAPASGLSPQ